MRCVSYTRTTSCRKGADTPSDIICTQNQHIQDYIKEKGWRLVEKYSDRKKSPEANEAFEKLTEDGIARKFDMVVVDSLDRCGKHICCAEDVLVKTFYPAGIHFAVVQDHFCSMGMSKQEIDDYIKVRKQKIRTSAMREYTVRRQIEGYYTVHDERYGYFLSDDKKKFLVDEEAAVVIRKIFKLLIEGFGYRKIRNILNQDGVESPLAHLTRVGSKNFPKSDVKWNAEAVRRIALCTAYDGYWVKTINGEKKTVPIERILDEGVFEKAQKIVQARTTTRNTKAGKAGIFSKKICDADTGEKLFQRNFKTGGTVFLKNPAIKEVPTNREMYIPYQSVVQAVREAVQNEMRSAAMVSVMIKNGKGLEMEKDEKERCFHRAEVIFQEMAEIEKERIPLYRKYEAGEVSAEDYQRQKEWIQEQLAMYDEDFRAVTEYLNDIGAMYGMDNLWLQAFQEQEVPEKLSLEDIKRWVEKVEIREFDEVIVHMVHRDWKAYFPEEWFEEV